MRKFSLLFVIGILTLTGLACAQGTPNPPGPIPTLEHSPFQANQTAYGFFPSPPKVSRQSVLDLYQAMGQHADVVLLQQNVPWKDFSQSQDASSQAITDIHNQYILAHQNGLEIIFVVDPLNGLNRAEFYNLPAGWKPSFSAPEVRAAFTNFTLRIVNEFHPLYLGLASEINTYADAHPEDFSSYLTLYQAVYDQVRAASPETHLFVTFQWEDLNNLAPFPTEGRQPFQTDGAW
jgi:hypothetical protein